MIVAFSRSLAKLRFQHRVTELPDGSLAYRLAKGGDHVRVSAAEWDETGYFFNEQTAPSLRRAKIALALWLPGYVVYIMLSNLLVPREIARGLPRPLYDTLFLGPFFVTPFIIYLWQSHRVNRISKAIDAFFSQRPRIPGPPARPWRVPFWLDLLCLLFVGPHVLVSIIGEFAPHRFDNTPYSGSHIGWGAAIGIVALAARLGWGLLERRQRRLSTAMIME